MTYIEEITEAIREITEAVKALLKTNNEDHDRLQREINDLKEENKMFKHILRAIRCENCPARQYRFCHAKNKDIFYIEKCGNENSENASPVTNMII